MLRRAIIKIEFFLIMSIEFFLTNLFGSSLSLAIPSRDSGYGPYRLSIYYIIGLSTTYRDLFNPKPKSKLNFDPITLKIPLINRARQDGHNHTTCTNAKLFPAEHGAPKHRRM